MKVKSLIRELSTMNPEAELSIAIYEPNDSGDQDHYEILCAVEYKHKDGDTVQIKGVHP